MASFSKNVLSMSMLDWSESRAGTIPILKKDWLISFKQNVARRLRLNVL